MHTLQGPINRHIGMAYCGHIAQRPLASGPIRVTNSLYAAWIPSIQSDRPVHPALVAMAARLIATGCLLLVILVSLCEAQSLHQKTSPGSNATITSDGLQVSMRLCEPRDIGINQFEISGVGLPTWQVEITNSCTNPRCSISNLVVQCGAFHSGPDLINPRLFRRLDLRQGTCIVNDGRRIGNADTIIFRYREIWKQPLRFRYARVSCQR